MHINTSNQTYYMNRQKVRFGGGQDFDSEILQQRNTAIARAKKADNLLEEAVIQKDETLAFVHQIARTADEKIDRLKKAKVHLEKYINKYATYINEIRDQIAANHTKKIEQDEKIEEYKKNVEAANRLAAKNESKGSIDRAMIYRQIKLPEFQAKIRDAEAYVKGLNAINTYHDESKVKIAQRKRQLNSFINELELEMEGLRAGKIMDKARRTVVPINQTLSMERESFDAIMRQNRRNLENFSFGPSSIEQELEDEVNSL